MSTEPNQTPPLDEKKKNALMRYLFVLFIVAFLMIALSFFMQMRDSNQTISELMQSNASALQNAEKLQEENRLLTDSLKETKEEIAQNQEVYENEIAGLTAGLEASEETKEAVIADSENLEAMVKDTMRGYEALLNGETSLKNGDLADAKAQIPVVESYLNLMGTQGVVRYELLLQGIDIAEHPVENPDKTPEDAQ